MTIEELKESKLPHEIAHVICLKCYKRWLAAYPEDTLLTDIECPQCHEIGYVIKTGQTLPKENPCIGCALFVNDKCKVGLSGNDPFCEYRKETDHE